jgi:hypothetical protein
LAAEELVRPAGREDLPVLAAFYRWQVELQGQGLAEAVGGAAAAMAAGRPAGGRADADGGGRGGGGDLRGGPVAGAGVGRLAGEGVEEVAAGIWEANGVSLRFFAGQGFAVSRLVVRREVGGADQGSRSASAV